MKKELAIGAVVVALSVGMASMASANSEDSDVNVTVSSDVALDVKPSELSYSGVNPGELDDLSDDGFFAVELENIGSESLEEIYAEATMPAATPFGSGDNTAYNTGNFLVTSTSTAVDQGTDAGIANTQEDQRFHFVNRLEFTESPEPSYIQTTSEAELDIGDLDSVDVGRFRTGSESYFYAIYHDEGTAGACADTANDDSFVFVGTEEHTSTNLGTFDFTIDDPSVADGESAEPSDTNVTKYELTNNDGEGEWGHTSSSVSLDDENYQLYTYCDDTDPGHTIRTRFNVDVTSPVTDDNLNEGGAGASKEILSSTSETLEPGASFPLDIGVHVPEGVAVGDMEAGRLSIIASDTS